MLNDAEGEAGETQTWIEFALRCRYIDEQQSRELDMRYERIIGPLVVMMQEADNRTFDTKVPLSHCPNVPKSPSPLLSAPLRLCGSNKNDTPEAYLWLIINRL